MKTRVEEKQQKSKIPEVGQACSVRGTSSMVWMRIPDAQGVAALSRIDNGDAYYIVSLTTGSIGWVPKDQVEFQLLEPKGGEMVFVPVNP